MITAIGMPIKTAASATSDKMEDFDRPMVDDTFPWMVLKMWSKRL
jgi:hypothetical protein